MLVHDPYYDVQGVSNSSLKHINPAEGGTPSTFKAHWDKTAPSLRTSSLEFGNLLHLAVLEPHLCEYEIDKSNTPDKIRDILKDMYSDIHTSVELAAAVTGDKVEVGPLEDHVYAVIAACDRQGYGRHWKEETRITKIMSQGSEYWDMIRGTEKFIITQDQYDLMQRCLASMNKNERIYDLMFLQMDNDDGVFYNELEVHWRDREYSFPLKAKIDRLFLNHKHKTFQLIDLKTTAKTLGQFHESFEKYHYARQMAFYTEAAHRWLEQNNIEGYTALTPIICAVETKGDNRAGMFYVQEDTWSKGWVEAENLLHRLQHHFSTDQWVDDMETDQELDYTL
jgi:hypothetical protein